MQGAKTTSAGNGDTRSWLYGVTYERAPVLTGISSGFLFQNVTGV